ncbi:NADPH-dependent 3-demethoxyubiquinone 3-hydroxylase, mitochondrial-like [Saccoglossus kowalevskii]|uniref:5-demethoxyubiquinone hydroxylase, mitochondrial n=1 Tax=Saccoglossus kowalevskii TaxID=10224 RepID=A0ABM0GUD9_SACKO|nr:PREDICTED: ubiquinone biosynthesis protein COQ7 homolog [Saccoglossus kowalevskii]
MNFINIMRRAPASGRSLLSQYPFTPVQNVTRYASTEDTQETRDMIDRIIRVDHAGELGADRIYAGQMAVLGNTSVGPVIKEMWEQEKKHLKTFEELIPQHRVRPTFLYPLWSMAGFALGAGSALLGKEGAMACTVAVEEVIGEHYDSQLRELYKDDPEKHKALLEIIKEFRDDELGHLDTGLQHDAEQAPLYSALTNVIKVGCRGAVWVAERI